MLRPHRVGGRAVLRVQELESAHREALAADLHSGASVPTRAAPSPQAASVAPRDHEGASGDRVPAADRSPRSSRLEDQPGARALRAAPEHQPAASAPGRSLASDWATSPLAPPPEQRGESPRVLRPARASCVDASSARRSAALEAPPAAPHPSGAQQAAPARAAAPDMRVEAQGWGGGATRADAERVGGDALLGGAEQMGSGAARGGGGDPAWWVAFGEADADADADAGPLRGGERHAGDTAAGARAGDGLGLNVERPTSACERAGKGERGLEVAVARAGRVAAGADGSGAGAAAAEGAQEREVAARLEDVTVEAGGAGAAGPLRLAARRRGDEEPPPGEVAARPRGGADAKRVALQEVGRRRANGAGGGGLAGGEGGAEEGNPARSSARGAVTEPHEAQLEAPRAEEQGRLENLLQPRGALARARAAAWRLLGAAPPAPARWRPGSCAAGERAVAR